MRQLLSALSHMPSLEALSLVRAIAFARADTITPQSIVLPRLAYFRLAGNVLSYSRMFDHLSLPSLLHLSISSMSLRTGGISDDLDSILPMLTYWSNRPGVGSILYLKCESNGTDVFFDTMDSDIPGGHIDDLQSTAPRLRLDVTLLQADDFQSAEEMLVRAVCNTMPLQNLETLCTTRLNLSEDRWWEFFGHLPRLKRHINRYDSDGRFLRALSAEDHITPPTGESCPRLYFPALEVLEIEGWNIHEMRDSDVRGSLELLLACFRKRSELHSPIQEFHIKRCIMLLSQDDMEQLEAAVQKVVWHRPESSS